MKMTSRGWTAFIVGLGFAVAGYAQDAAPPKVSSTPSEARVVIAAPSSTSEPPSDATAFLATLEGMLGDEEGVVRAAREFDHAQLRLAEQEAQEAAVLERDAKKEQADAKRNSAQQRVETIEKAYERILERYPNNVRALNYHAELRYDQYHDVDKAVAEWRLAGSLDPKYSAAQNNLGLHYCHEGDYERGFQCLNAALELEPKNPDYLFNIVQMMLVYPKPAMKFFKWDEKRLYKEAMKRSLKARDLQPGDFDLAKDYAVNFFAAEQFDLKADWEKAADAWVQARALAPNDVERFYAWLNEARAAIRDADRDRARNCLTEALRLEPNSDVAKNLMERLASPAKDDENSRDRARTDAKTPRIRKK